MSAQDPAGAAEPPEHRVIAYHERTKHHFHQYAASLGYMDWATQPDPFRRFDGATLYQLPLPDPGYPVLYDAALTAGTGPAALLTTDAVSRFLRYSLSITAWKSAGAMTWALRANPSSGNLHPTEGYLVLPSLSGLADAAAVYHYAPRLHALECRGRLREGVRSLTFDAWPAGTFIVGLSSIHWREAWKYGERAFRYCQHDVGHALAGLRIAAAMLGWRLTLLSHLPSSTVARTLGLDRDDDFEHAEREEAELLALVTPTAADASLDSWTPPSWDDEVEWTGRANALSRAHGVSWPAIDEVALASRRLATTPLHETSRDVLADAEAAGVTDAPRAVTAEHVVLTRRSAVAMDGVSSLPAAAFFRMLARLMPTADRRAVPWDAVPWRPRIHLVLFVHRVEGVNPGVYVLPRDLARRDALRAAMRPEFQWEQVSSAPSGLPLSRLLAGDCRALAVRVSCGQDIAGDGAFSVGMLADFTESLAQRGAPFYRNLFWESGMIGQVLYLEAEAAGCRGTGIGCFFDDPVREVCGVTSHDWQSLYHFTIGGPVDDSRLTTLPAYPSAEARS